jgi:hypothetical protein
MLTIDLVEGTVQACKSQIITLTYDFNTIAKIIEYSGSFKIKSNDPENPEIVITLSAYYINTEAPVLSINKTTSTVTSTGLDIIEDQITISNIGNANLTFEIKNIDFHEMFTISPLTGMVQAGDYQTITLSYDFANVEKGEYLGSFKFLSNDPLHLETEITLHAFQNYNGIDLPRMSLLYIYPNPANDEIRISNYELREGVIEIFDVYGKNVLKLETRNPKSETIINVSSLSSGIYFIKIDNNFYKFVKN